MRIGRPCVVCGRRTEGSGRCVDHATGGGRARACAVCLRPTEGADYCPDHAPRNVRQPSRAAYSSAEYRRNRAEALRRDGYACRVSGCRARAADGAQIEVDHVLAIIDGGTNDLSNLVSMCVEHHRAKTAADRSARS